MRPFIQIVAPIQALVWEIWAANRRAWIVVLTVIPLFAVVFQLLAAPLKHSDGLQTIGIIPAFLMLTFVMSIFNFTEVNPRKGFAGFPQRLFTMPAPTWLLVGCPMLCGVIAVVGLYVAWAELVFHPAGLKLLVRWPATLLAAAVVFYQTIVWCLSAHRIARLFVLGLALTLVTAIGFLPHMPPSIRGMWTEEKLTAAVFALGLGAYGLAVVVIGNQRRGGGRSWVWRAMLADRLADALPHRQWKLNSPQRALLWIEWRRGGWVLPAAVLVMLLLIIGPVNSVAPRNPTATDRATFWVAVMPLLLAIVIGKGMAKPDFWSMELSLTPFVAARPIDDGQIVAAKLKSAALSTLLAWGLLLAIAPLWIYLSGDVTHLRNLWGMFRTVYSPWAQAAIPLLLLLAAMTATWSLMVGSIWLGCCGRPALYYTGVALTVVALNAIILGLATCFDLADDDNAFILTLMPWLPWVIAGTFILKIWIAAASLMKVRRDGLISERAVTRYLCGWAAASGCFIAFALLLAPAVVWLRDFLLLAALLSVPLARVAAAPLAVAWNRHR